MVVAVLESWIDSSLVVEKSFNVRKVEAELALITRCVFCRGGGTHHELQNFANMMRS